MDTTTLGLKKPLTSEAYDIQIFNDNADKTNELILADREQINSLAADYIRSPGYGVTTGSANVYSLTLNPALAAYIAGVCVAVKINVANTGTSTININGLGAKPIKDSKGNALTSGKLALNVVYTLRYDGTNFILQGEGGEYGTATSSDVLSGKTIGTDSGLVTGTIPSKVAATITPNTIAQTIAAGQYLSGIQTIAGDADLISANIKAGANIFGVAGSSQVVDTSAGDAVASEILTTKKAYVDGALVTGTMANKGAVTLTPGAAAVAIPAGYHNGSGVVSGVTNLVAGNIKSGVNVGGVVGTVTPGFDTSEINFRPNASNDGLFFGMTEEYKTSHTTNARLIKLENVGFTVNVSSTSPIIKIDTSGVKTTGTSFAVGAYTAFYNPNKATITLTGSGSNFYMVTAIL